MKTVIIVNGRPRAGKDTVIGIMRQALIYAPQPRRSTVGQFSSIDPVKVLLGRSGLDLSKKTEADRRLLSIVGEALEEHSEFRTKASIAQIFGFFEHLLERSHNGVFFLQMREPHLIEKVVARCKQSGINAVKVYVTSDRALEISSNPSDAGVDLGIADRVIENDGSIRRLTEKCHVLLRELDLI